MKPAHSETLSLQTDEDLVHVRQKLRARMVEQGFTLIEQTKMVTAASELGRNALVYGGGGTARLESVEDSKRQGLRVIIEDQGPGISNIEQAMTDGYTSGSGLGLGLGGSKRLVKDFELWSEPGLGTRVTIILWRKS